MTSNNNNNIHYFTALVERWLFVKSILGPIILQRSFEFSADTYGRKMMLYWHICVPIQQEVWNCEVMVEACMKMIIQPSF